MNYLDTSKLKFSKSTDDLLLDANSRKKCPNCNQPRKYYCYNCVIPLNHVPPTPPCRLPIQFHIIRHNSEKPAKSSIIPLKLSYPDDVFLYTFTQPNRFDQSVVWGELTPDFGDQFEWEQTALLFPEKGTSMTVNEMDPILWKGVVEGSPSETGIRNVIVIDSTWSTAVQVIKRCPKIATIKFKITLSPGNKTIFWRHQSIDRSCLATCEAIYALLREIFDLEKRQYQNEYDDVMFYYVFIHGVISEYYSRTKKHRGHLPDYTLNGS